MKKKIKLIVVICIMYLTVSAQVTDIDGNTYKTVKIGNQEWMAEDLRVTKFNDGEKLYYYGDENREKDLVHLNNYYFYKTDNEEIGLLYPYGLYRRPNKSLCPKGWKQPTLEDLKILEKTLGEEEAGKKLKSVAGWPDGSNGNNEAGFNAAPMSGFYSWLRGTLAMWWASEGSWGVYGNDTYDHGDTPLDANKIYFYTYDFGHDTDMLPIRCLKINSK